MGSGWARLGIAIGGALLGGWMLGPMLGAQIGMSVGFFAGSYLGSELFPTDYESEMPSVHDYPVQSTAVGIPVGFGYGTNRFAGNVIWMGDLTPYQIKHSVSGGGGKGGGGDEQVSYETNYYRSFLISICEGPGNIVRAWKGKTEILTTSFTFYDGDGNSGISTLIGEDYSEYSNLCLAYFESYGLGSSQSIPNFIFEVSTGVGDADTRICDLVVGGNKITTPYSCVEMTDAQGNYSHVMVPGSAQPKQANQIVKYVDGDYLIAVTDWGSGGVIYKVQDDGTLVWSKSITGEEALAVYSDTVDVGIYACGLQPFPGTGDRLFRLDPTNGNIVWDVLLGSLNPIYDIIAGDSGYLYVLDIGTLSGSLRYIRRIARSNGGIDWTSGSNNHMEGRIALDGYGFIFSTGKSGSEASVICLATDDSGYENDVNDVEYVFSGSNGYGGIQVVNAAGIYLTYVYVGVNTAAGGYVAMLGLLGPTPSSPPPGLEDPIFALLETYNIGGTIYSITIDTDGALLVCHDKATGQSGEEGHITKLALDLSYHGCLEVDNDRVGFVRSMARGSGTILLGSLLLPDTNFAEMIKDLLIGEKKGNYKESDLITEDFESIILYCETNGLKGSLAITQQKPLPDWIAYICSHFQGYFYEIGGKIGLNCYRSQASDLSITQDDLVREGDDPPVHITKRNYSSTFNRLEATWTDRTNIYKTAVVPAFDRVDQSESGQIRTKTMDLKAITSSDLATKMAWRIFIDQIYRFSQYTFKLGYKSMLLEVGDVIDVTDGHLLTEKKMRVMRIGEEKDGRTSLITAIEDIADFYPTIGYSTQESEAAGDPDITLTDGTIAFRESTNSSKLYLSITPGGTQCNGFYIYVSYDNASYSLVGKAAIENVTGGEANSTGTIRSGLSAHTVVIHRRLESFNVSIGTITDLNTAISDDDFFNNRKLAKIGDEIIAYKTCVETSVAGIWQVSNLIRGLFGTKPVAHVSGETFTTLDIDFSYALQESDIGKTLYFKVVSLYAKEIQLIADVSSQSHVVSGKYIKPLPISLMRINGREGLSTYKTVDVTLDWYFCSKQSGFGRGGYGNALWGAYIKDPLLERLKVELEEEDGTPITDSSFELDAYGEPAQLEILEADRNSKNPIVVKLSPMSNLLGDSRQITIEKI